MWCPKLDLIENENKDSKWKNKIESDRTKIYETLKNDKKRKEDSPNWDKKYVTFAQYSDENGIKMYKFIGVFILDKVQKG